MVYTALLFLVGYLIAGTVLAMLARRMGVQRAMDYYVAGYRLGGVLAALTYAATTYSAFMIVGLVGFAYQTGVGSLGFELVYFVGTMLILSLLAPRVWVMARQRGWVSPAEMLGDLYGSKVLPAVISVLYLVALIPYMGAQVKGIAEAVNGLFPGAYMAGILLGVLVMIVWTVVAGIWSVAVTDALQGILMITAGLGLLAWLLGFVESSIGLGKAAAILDKKGLLALTPFWSITTFLGFTIPWFFFAATNPQVVQRLFMPKDKRAFSAMVRWFAFFGLLYTVVVTLIGLFAASLSHSGVLPLVERKDEVTPMLLSYAPPLLSAIVFTSIVAAAVSTADSIALSVASSVVRDLYVNLNPRASERLQVLLGRIIVVVLIVAAAAVAMARIGFIVALSVLSSAILLSLAPASLLAWVSPEQAKGKAHAALVSIVVGGLLGIVAALVYGTKALATPIMGLPIPAWILIVSTITLLAIPRKLDKTM